MKLSARSAVSAIHDAARTQLWPIPTLGVVLAVVLGILIPNVDAGVDNQLPSLIDQTVFSGDASAARTVLDAVASSLITVTSLTFSLTVVTLQLASSQFSPRLLRNFTQDIFVQVTLALFMATFTYSLTVLRFVRSSQESATPFVPRLGVTTSFLLALASVIALVLFLAHLTRQIRVETMLRNVYRDATDTMRDNLELRRDTEPRRGEKPARGEQAGPPVAPPAHAQILWARGSGFLLRIDQGELLRETIARDAVVHLNRHPGSFVVAGTPLGRIWAVGGGHLPQDVVDDFIDHLSGAVHLGAERTAAQDVGYGLRQLTDVTNKALSPGINDPTTAIHALGHTAALLSELTRYRLEPLRMSDDHGRTRVVLERPTFELYLDLALTQPRAYGSSDTELLARLYELLDDLAWHVQPDQRQAVQHQLDRLDATVADQGFDQTETDNLRQLSHGVRESLADRQAPGPV